MFNRPGASEQSPSEGPFFGLRRSSPSLPTWHATTKGPFAIGGEAIGIRHGGAVATVETGEGNLDLKAFGV